jgi:hypothetical protein
MFRQCNLVLALTVGFAGGFLSRYIVLPPVLAQGSAPKVIQAQSFALVDEKNDIIWCV